MFWALNTHGGRWTSSARVFIHFTILVVRTPRMPRTKLSTVVRSVNDDLCRYDCSFYFDFENSFLVRVAATPQSSSFLRFVGHCSFGNSLCFVIGSGRVLGKGRGRRKKSSPEQMIRGAGDSPDFSVSKVTSWATTCAHCMTANVKRMSGTFLSGNKVVRISRALGSTRPNAVNLGRLSPKAHTYIWIR